MNIQDYQILTPQGFKQFDGIKKFTSYEYLILSFDSGQVVKCTKNHIFFDNANKHIKAENMKEGDMLYGGKKIIKVQYIMHDKEEQFFDIVNVGNQDNSFIVEEGIKSHNSAGSRCIIGSSKVRIRNKQIGKIEDITIQQLHKRYPYSERK